MHESNDRPERDPIAASIELAAGSVTVPDAVEFRRNVQSTFERRRRRRRSVALTGIVGATALVSGLVLVAVVGDDGPGDRLMSGPAASTPESEPEPSDTTAPPSDQAAGDDAPATTSPAATAPSASSAPIRVTGSSSQSVFDDAGSGIDGGGVGLFAWNDGFLAVRRSFGPQALPGELPEELAAAFPQEVLDLFPDGLPATLEEATIVLQEAGLFDVVSDIVLSNAEVRDAIYADRPEPITSVRFSVDGVDWNDVDADLPTGDSGYPIRDLVAGDRFVVVTEPAADSGEAGRYYDVHVSADLVQWDVQRIVFPERVEQRGVRYFVQLDGFAGNESGWIASVSTFADIDVAALLPEDVLSGNDVTGADAGGWVDTGYDSGGVYVERYDDDGVSAERRTYTWAELGLDGPPITDGVDDRIGFVSEWNGVPQQVDVDESLHGVDRFSDGFVQFGDRMRVSSDGVDWTDLALPADGWVSWVLDTSDGLLVSTDGRDGSAFHLLDSDTMTWTPVELPGISSGAQVASPPGGGAILFADYGEPDYVQPATIRLTAEAEGYALTIVVDVSSSGDTGAASYEVLDVASGQVVVTESVDEFAGFDAFTSLRDRANGGFVVDDIDTGEVLVEFDPSTIANQSLDENGDVVPEPDYGAVEFVPVHWVVAALSDQLLVEEVVADVEWLSGTAVQGNTVLIALGDGSFVRLTSQ